MIRIGQAYILLAENGITKAELRDLADRNVIPCQRNKRGYRFFDVADVVAFKNRLRQARIAGAKLGRRIAMSQLHQEREGAANDLQTESRFS